MPAGVTPWGCVLSTQFMSNKASFLVSHLLILLSIISGLFQTQEEKKKRLLLVPSLHSKNGFGPRKRGKTVTVSRRNGLGVCLARLEGWSHTSRVGCVQTSSSRMFRRRLLKAAFLTATWVITSCIWEIKSWEIFGGTGAWARLESVRESHGSSKLGVGFVKACLMAGKAGGSLGYWGQGCYSKSHGESLSAFLEEVRGGWFARSQRRQICAGNSNILTSAPHSNPVPACSGFWCKEKARSFQKDVLGFGGMWSFCFGCLRTSSGSFTNCSINPLSVSFVPGSVLELWGHKRKDMSFGNSQRDSVPWEPMCFQWECERVSPRSHNLQDILFWQKICDKSIRNGIRNVWSPSPQSWFLIPNSKVLY